MRTLVLGGSGYIGSALCKELEDYEVYDLKLSQDIRNINNLVPYIDRADTIIHLAGSSMDPRVEANPEVVYKTNYKANEVIANLVKNTGKRLVFASSGSVYGNQDGPCTITSPFKPLSMYAKTKTLSEDLFKQKGVNSVILRFATVFGPSPNTRYDTVVNRMIHDSYFKKEITVMGGNKKRALVHVKDVIEIIKFYAGLYGNFLVNVVGFNTTIMGIADIIRKKTGAKIVKKDDATGDDRTYEMLPINCTRTIEEAVEEFYKEYEVSGRNKSK